MISTTQKTQNAHQALPASASLSAQHHRVMSH